MRTSGFLLIILGFVAVVGGFVLAQSNTPSPVAAVPPDLTLTPFWEYQCVDTMKSSRDRARAWIQRKDLNVEIQRQMQSISSMGATCVSIGTPYDEEFVPYLRAWVNGARNANLKVWFRGNFSGWEGWFDYPRITTTAEHVSRTATFIKQHPELFSDGDIFTPAPEAENGGPFNAGRADQYEQYRRFLAASYATCLSTFNDLGKNVTCNWFSMSGGHAKGIFNPDFTKEIGSLVTIDHYVRDTRDMGEFIDYFRDKMNSKVVLGEFGGPIPDLNGNITKEEQAVLVRHIFEEMFERRDHIAGINYWTLMEGSTKLLNDDYTERPVVNVLRDYYNPGGVVGKVVDSSGKCVPGAFVTLKSFPVALHTDNNGYFSILLPSGEYAVSASNAGKETILNEVFVPRSEKVNITITLN